HRGAPARSDKPKFVCAPNGAQGAQMSEWALRLFGRRAPSKLMTRVRFPSPAPILTAIPARTDLQVCSRHRDRTRREKMVRLAVLSLSLIVVAAAAAQAQDIAGIEDCTKTSGLDKRTGCLQSNVNFLQRLVTKNALESFQKLNAANAEIVALKAAGSGLQKTVEQLQAAQKAAGDKKPESKERSGSPMGRRRVGHWAPSGPGWRAARSFYG